MALGDSYLSYLLKCQRKRCDPRPVSSHPYHRGICTISPIVWPHGRSSSRSSVSETDNIYTEERTPSPQSQGPHVVTSGRKMAHRCEKNGGRVSNRADLVPFPGSARFSALLSGGRSSPASWIIRAEAPGGRPVPGVPPQRAIPI